MADIIAKVVDQAVIIENTPVIASGGVNEDRVVFDFSASWNGYIKTCVFYRAETHIAIPVIMDDDTAVIPAEVIAQPGKFLFGVVGEKADVTYTSEMVMFRVNVGAKTELIPSPTADIYAQIIEMIADNVTPTQIREIHKRSIIKFWVGTQAEYDAITPQNGVFYIIYDVDPIEELDERVTALEQHAGSDLNERVTALETSVAGIINGIGSASDYVVQHGTHVHDGVTWNYRLWHSGIVELWTSIHVTSPTISVVGDFEKIDANIALDMWMLTSDEANIQVDLARQTTPMWYGGHYREENYLWRLSFWAPTAFTGAIDFDVRITGHIDPDFEF